MVRCDRLLHVLFLFVLSGSGLATADEPPRPQAIPAAAKQTASKFVRLERDADDELTGLQTAIVTFTKLGEQSVSVDLIGAVHVGDRSYYDALNEVFSNYDVVLYELVAPSGTRVPKGQKARNVHLAGAFQNAIKGVLALEHQLEMIDYTQDNMLHADMSPDDFRKSMEDRGESFMGLIFKFMEQGIAQQSRAQAKGKNFDADLLAALFDKNRAIALKRVAAEQFQDLETSMAIFSDKGGSTIITERNKVALKKLDEQLKAGKKHIAIFYGAGHMPHLEKLLVADFGLQRASERWLTAWNLTQPAVAGK